MSAELDGIKALLDAHLTNLNQKLDKLSTNYESIRATVQSIENQTGVAIAEVRKDINSIGLKAEETREDLKAIKLRIEVNEDSQLERWTTQNHLNDLATKREGRIMTLQVGAIGTFIALAIATLWERLVAP